MNEQAVLQNQIDGPSKIVLSSSLLISEVKEFLLWWYVEMPAWYISLIQRIVLICDDTLSISLLFKTFFIPWHRDYSMVGRGFGIAMRLLYLPVALSLTLGLVVIFTAVAIAWALLPFIAVISILRTPFL